MSEEKIPAAEHDAPEETDAITLTSEDLGDRSHAHVLAAAGAVVLEKLGIPVKQGTEIDISDIPGKIVITLTWDKP
jgi:hypothetical protein